MKILINYMKKNLILFIIISLSFAFPAFALEVGKWTFVVEDNYCYIGSAPTKEEGKYDKRGDTYTLVYRINKGPEKIVQITAGYNYDEKKPIIVKIDQTKFEFFGNGDTAWTRDKDREHIKEISRLSTPNS